MSAAESAEVAAAAAALQSSKRALEDVHTEQRQLNKKLRRAKLDEMREKARARMAWQYATHSSPLMAFLRIIAMALKDTIAAIFALPKAVIVAFIITYIIAYTMLGAREVVIVLAGIFTAVMQVVGVAWDDILLPIIGVIVAVINVVAGIVTLGTVQIHMSMKSLEIPQPQGTNGFWDFYWAVVLLPTTCAHYTTVSTVLGFFVKLASNASGICQFTRFTYPQTILGSIFVPMLSWASFDPTPGNTATSCLEPEDGMLCAIFGIGFVLRGPAAFYAILIAFLVYEYMGTIVATLHFIVILLAKPAALLVATYAPLLERSAHDARIRLSDALARTAVVAANAEKATKVAAHRYSTLVDAAHARLSTAGAGRMLTEHVSGMLARAITRT